VINQLHVKDYGRKLETIPETEIKDSYTTAELGEYFIVHGFSAPFVIVTRKSDNRKGSLEFTHNPRIYFNFR